MIEASDARWPRIKSIVGEAIELAPGLRAAAVERACGADRALRDEVEALLRAHDQAGAFLEAPALASPGAARVVVEAADSHEPGDTLPLRFGAYRVLRELGRGGMGIVYLGARDDDAFDKHVAVKAVGEGVHPAAFRRFEDERRILAALDHPNIARLLDAGTTGDGVPYVVMEYVAGETIDEYCAKRGLGVPERLQLFLSVCRATQYSHQHLVVHRDIKARNILVGEDGVPKLLDFGIAKLLEPGGAEGSRTRTAFRVLTPESASPEQVRGEPSAWRPTSTRWASATHRRSPGRGYRGGMTTDPEIVRAICDEEPVRPSAAAQQRELRGDLDHITLMALRKDPARRYASVEQLAQDVQRHLDRLPVRAAPDALAYRARKFVERRWVGLAAGAAIGLALLAGGAASWWQAKRAERRFNDVRHLARTVMFDVHDAIANVPGSTKARKLLVTEALAYLDSLAAEAGNDPSLQRELAAGYHRMGDVLGWPGTPNLGDVPGALKAYAKAQAVRERILARDPDNADVLGESSVTMQRMSRALYQTGDPQAGAEEARKSTVIEERLAVLAPGTAQQFRLARSYANHGYLLFVGGRTADSLKRLREATSLLEQLCAANPANTEMRARLAVTYGYLAGVLWQGKPVGGVVPDLKAALDMQRKAVAIDASLAAEAATDPRLQRQAMIDQIGLAQILEEAGRQQDARELYREGLARTERLALADSANLQAQKDLAWATMRLGVNLAQGGSAQEAMTLLERAAKLFEPVLAADPGGGNARSMQIGNTEGFGHAFAALASDRRLPRETRLRHWREARSRFQEAYAFWVDMREKGAAVAADASRPEKLAREIAKCDAALGAASARSDPPPPAR
jgi:non-specific serine/threonine protein kinase/serine/threonine-protein kinase